MDHSFIPHELRKRIYAEVLRLSGEGHGYKQISEKLVEKYGVTVSKSTISYWVRGIYTPYYRRPSSEERVRLYHEACALYAAGYGCRKIAKKLRVSPSTVKDWVAGKYSPYGPESPELPRPRYHERIVRLKPTPELAYVVGAIIGDGSAFRQGYGYYVTLRAKDREFVEEVALCLSSVLGRRVRMVLERTSGQYYTRAYSRALYELLKKPPEIEKLRPYVEHCTDCMAAFIRGFADAEGSVSHQLRIIHIANTNLELLRYVQELLGKLKIETTGPYLGKRRGTVLIDPRTGREYLRRRDNYLIQVRTKSLPRFYERVGFTIGRKRAMLEQFISRRQPLS